MRFDRRQPPDRSGWPASPLASSSPQERHGKIELRCSILPGSSFRAGVMGDVAAKLLVTTKGGVDLRLLYDGHFNARTSIQDVDLEASMKF